MLLAPLCISWGSCCCCCHLLPGDSTALKHLQVATHPGVSPLLPGLAPAFQQLVVPSSQQPCVFPLHRCSQACSFLELYCRCGRHTYLHTKSCSREGTAGPLLLGLLFFAGQKWCIQKWRFRESEQNKENASRDDNVGKLGQGAPVLHHCMSCPQRDGWWGRHLHLCLFCGYGSSCSVDVVAGERGDSTEVPRASLSVTTHVRNCPKMGCYRNAFLTFVICVLIWYLGSLLTI